MLFEVALIEHPKPKDAEENGALEKIILEPTCVVARDAQAASVMVVLNNKDKIECDMSRLQVLVRPFAP